MRVAVLGCAASALPTSASKRSRAAEGARSDAPSTPIGNASSLFQKLSNTLDSSRTTGPADSMSMSMKLAALPRMKYSSATLRPPVTANVLSAMKSLLCMRRLMRSKSCSENSTRVVREPERTGSGLNSRTCTFGCAARASEQLVARVGVQVIDEQTHPHPPLRGVAQTAQKLPARVVGRDQVVLNVERFLREMQQRLAHRQAFGAVRQQPNAGMHAHVSWRGSFGDVGKRGAADIGKRRGAWALDVCRQDGTAGEQRQRQRQRQQRGGGNLPAQGRGRAGKCARVRVHRYAVRFARIRWLRPAARSVSAGRDTAPAVPSSRARPSHAPRSS